MSNFDKNIKRKLDRYESRVSGDMWAKIEAGLPANENAPVRRWWIPVFGVVILASLSLGLHFYNLSTADSLMKGEASLYTKIESKSTNSDVSISPQNKLNNLSSITSVSNNTIKGENSNDNYSSISNVESRKDVVLANNAKNILNQSRDVVQVSEEGSKKEETDETVKTTPTRSASLYEQYNSILKAARSDDKEGHSQIIEREVEDIAPVIPGNSLLNFDDSELPKVLSSMSGKRTICPSFKNVRFGIFAEAFYSNDYGLRDLSYNYLGSEYNYLDARNNTESANYSFSAGARVSFIMPSGFGAKTGFNYSQINEAFNYQDPEHQKTKTVIVKEYVWENNVIVDSMETTTEVVVNGELNVVSQNKYKVIDLPLLLTYEWGYRNRFYYSITGGPLFNISFRQQGKFLNPETLTPVDFSSNGGNYDAFNTNIGTSLYLSFALNYQLGNGADLFVEPNVRHQLNKATLNTYELNQKYTILGLGFGIKYKL